MPTNLFCIQFRSNLVLQELRFSAILSGLLLDGTQSLFRSKLINRVLIMSLWSFLHRLKISEYTFLTTTKRKAASGASLETKLGQLIGAQRSKSGKNCSDESLRRSEFCRAFFVFDHRLTDRAWSPRMPLF